MWHMAHMPTAARLDLATPTISHATPPYWAAAAIDLHRGGGGGG